MIDELITIYYTNSRNFDGIDYSNETIFTFSFKGVFFHENNPTESEDIILSSGEIVTLNQSIQQKKRLDIGYMPPYMHLKLQKILMHETIMINGEQWKKRDAYDSEPINKYGLKKASVWLTLYNSVQNNTL